MAKEREKSLIKPYKIGVFDQIFDFLLWATVLVIVGASLWFTYKEQISILTPKYLLFLLLILGYNVTLRTERRKNYQRRERLSYLTQASVSLASSLDLESILRMTAEAAILLVKDSSACLICQIDEEQNLNPVFQLGISGKPDARFGKQVLEKGSSTKIPIKKDAPDWSKPYKELVGIPLVSGDNTIGTIEVYIRKRSAKPEDIEFLTILASYATPAIVNAASYEETVLELKKEKASLLALTKVDRSVREERLNLADQLNLILKEAFRATGAMKSEIWIAEDGELSCFTTYPLIDMVYGVKIKQGEGLVGHCAKTKRPINCPDLSAESRFINHLKRDVASGLFLPLIYREKVVGVISLFNKRGKEAFTKDDIQVLEGLATQAAIAISQAKTYFRLKNIASSLAALYEVSRTLAEGRELDKVLQLILKKGCELFSAEHGSIMLLDEKTGELTIKTAIGLSDEIIRNTKKYVGDGSIAGWVAKHREPLTLLGKVADERFRSVKEKVKDALCVPIITKNRLIGVFSLSNRKGTGVFAQKDMELLTTLANEAGLAIETALLYDLTQKRVKELLGIKRIASEMVITKELKEVLISCLNIGRDILGAEFSWFFLKRDGKFVLHSAQGKGRVDERDFMHAVIGDGTIKWVGERKESLIIDNCEQDSRFSPTKGLDAKTLLAVPILKQKEVLGVIEFLNKKPYFTKDDLRTAQVLANQMAIAIDNASLFHQTKRRALELSTVNQMVKAMIATTDMDELLKKVVTFTLKVMRSKKCWLHFIEDRELILKAEVGLNDMEKKREGGLSLYKGIAGVCAAEKMPLLIVNIKEEKNVREEDKRMYKPGSYLSVPIVIKDEAKGVISCADRLQGVYTEDDLNLLVTISAQVAIAIDNAHLYSEIERYTKDTFKTLSGIVEARDPQGRGHSEKVSKYAALLAKEAGLSKEEQERVKDAALLCDIGKIGVSEEILAKEESDLTPQEEARLKRHPFMSVQMLRSHVFLKPIIPLIYHHHENYDGTGYLDGLSGEDIPIGSRIIAIVDTYFSMIQKGRSEQEARDFLRNRSGARFDPELISIFINKVLEKEAGYG